MQKLKIKAVAVFDALYDIGLIIMVKMTPSSLFIYNGIQSLNFSFRLSLEY